MSRYEGKATDARRTLRRLAGYLRPFWPPLTLVVGLVLIATLLQLAGPYLIGRAIDEFIEKGDRRGLATTMWLLLGTYLGAWGAQYGQYAIMAIVGQKVLYNIRTQIFDRILTLSLRFFDEHEAGDLISRLVNDVDVINQVLNVGLVQTASSGLTLIGIVAAMLRLNTRLAWATSIIVPVMGIATVFFSERARTAFRRTRYTIGEVSADLEENIAGVRVAQAFAREGQNIERFDELNRANRDANVSAQGITAAFSPTLDVLSTIGLAVVIGYGGYLALHDLVTVGVIVSFLAYVRHFFQPIQQIAQLYAQLQSALAGAERIFELVDTEPEVVDAPEAVEMPPIRGRVEFDQVSFRYQPEEPVLDDVSLVAEPGQVVALVGPTGAGKTTIAHLIGRFYDVAPWKGTVRIDGYDVREVTRASLRRQMGIVLQETFLFSNTVMENIRYGRLDATDEEVIEAAKQAHAHSFITRLPQGYQTRLSERGSNLSQGQRQLLSIARAILADPRILILDEATSSVDTRTELLIQQALAQLLLGRTSIVIAHRLSTIRRADQLLVIDEGRIVERGTHDDLLARRGVYYDLYTSQFRRRPARAG
jgi:ATP-binding cassette subfamily B protein/subfamily B ATP-binding cassette protein MsbA